MKTMLKPATKGKEKYSLKITVNKELNNGASINAMHPKNKEVDRFLKKFDLSNLL